MATCLTRRQFVAPRQLRALLQAKPYQDAFVDPEINTSLTTSLVPIGTLLTTYRDGV
jgi:hypothetical protein